MKIVKKTSHLILFLLLTFFVKAQTNFIPNSSFEIDTACPPSLGELTYVANWYAPTDGSPDYYNSCNTGVYCSVPYNFFGNQKAYNNGAAYTGMYVYGTQNQNYREYIQAKLTTTLVAGKNYFVSFNVSLSESSHYSIDCLGAYFSANSFSVSNYTALSFTPQISNTSGQLLTDTSSWHQINGVFTAQGGERFITIGNFKDDSHTGKQKTVVNVDQYSYAYYYIDQVCLSQNASTCEFISTVNLIEYSTDMYSFYFNSEVEKIIFSKPVKGKTIEVLDLFGKELVSVKLEAPYEIDTSSLKKGYYFIRITDETSSITKKVMIY